MVFWYLSSSHLSSLFFLHIVFLLGLFLIFSPSQSPHSFIVYFYFYYLWSSDNYPHLISSVFLFPHRVSARSSSSFPLSIPISSSFINIMKLSLIVSKPLQLVDIVMCSVSHRHCCYSSSYRSRSCKKCFSSPLLLLLILLFEELQESKVFKWIKLWTSNLFVENVRKICSHRDLYLGHFCSVKVIFMTCFGYVLYERRREFLFSKPFFIFFKFG